MRRAGACLILLGSVAACGVRQSAGPVPVEGPRAGLDSLSGEWRGEYWTTGPGRHGTLRFTLRPGADTAYREVEMTFSPSLRLYGDSGDADLKRRPCTVIDIAVVRLEGPRVRGTLAPYWDPDCDCRAVTVFEGGLSANRVEGTFTSRTAPSEPARLTGHWYADRTRGR